LKKGDRGGFKSITPPYSSAIGTLVHNILQQISLDGIETWTKEKIDQSQKNWRALLIQLGVLPKQLENAMQQINTAITNTLSDPHGQWILQPHKNAQSELAISTTINNELKRYIIDRTFIDEQDQRWIIDYKTTNHTGNNLDQFLSQEKVRHQQQLQNYAKIINELYPTKNKIHFGLYFPWCRVFTRYT